MFGGLAHRGEAIAGPQAPAEDLLADVLGNAAVEVRLVHGRAEGARQYSTGPGAALPEPTVAYGPANNGRLAAAEGGAVPDPDKWRPG